MKIITDVPDDELVELVDDDARPGEEACEMAWRVLIVDDDEQVHSSTVFALSDIKIQGRRLQFLHAYSAIEARRILETESDVAVVLLDVVMESGHAGLALVKVIRTELGLSEPRLILRTGQPGYAPEIEAVRDYDINDYRTKAELTRVRLVTSLTAAIRSYEQIRTISYGRRGLEKIVRSAAELFEKRALESLAEGVLTHIAGLLRIPANGLVCAQRGYPIDGSDPQNLYVVGAVGRYASAINEPLKSLGEAHIVDPITESIRERRNIYGKDHTVLYLHSPGGTEEAIYIESSEPLDELDRGLLEVFAMNISVGFTNVYLFRRLSYLAYYDPFTGLPNRQRLVEVVDRHWATTDEAGLSVFLVDVDRFSEINDVMGPTLGDALLRAIAERMRSRLSREIEVGRYGGDVFCVLSPFGKFSSEALFDLFNEPFSVDGYHIPVAVTIGEYANDERLGGLDVLKNAGLALTHAKSLARGHSVAFTTQMAIASRERLELIHALRQAVHEQRLHLFFQPQIELETGRVVGAEALLRWWNDEGEEISPAVFVPLAEQAGLIRSIGVWVIGEACRQVARWREDGLGDLRMAINVSAQQIRFGCCASDLASAIEENSIQPSQVEIEVTESMLLDDIEMVSRCFGAYRELGVKIALDDFGTGFSSLSYLNRLPIDVLKIDRGFMHGIGAGKGSARIPEMIATLGRQLSLETVAEGIETDAQRLAAIAWGCNRGQGFLFSRAMSGGEFSDWLRARGSATEMTRSH